MAAASISISSPKYCFPKSTNMKIDLENGQAYVDNSLLFNVEEASISLHNRHVLHDSGGNPIFTLYNKILTMHDRWEVFKGDSTSSDHLIFTVRRKRMIQWGIINLEVFLAKNEANYVCDFAVESLLKQTCTVFDGSSSTPIAKMKKTKGSNYEVTVNPNTDLAFIATLMIILHNTKHVDGISSTTLRIARMTVDPLDATGLLLDGFGESIVETIVEFIPDIVEKITENVSN